MTGSVVAVHRQLAAPRPGVAVAAAAPEAVPAAPAPSAPAPSPAFACHDAPTATQAAGGPPIALRGAAPAGPRVAAPPATAPTKAIAPPAPPSPRVAAADTTSGCHPTPEQAAAASKLLEDTRTAIARFRQPASAEVAGYHWVGYDNAYYSRVFHYANYGYYTDDHVADPNHVEGLLYAQTDHHGLVLVGAYYLVKDPTPPDTAGCATPWHKHPGSTDWMLHVWTVDMPGGPFAETWNPNDVANM